MVYFLICLDISSALSIDFITEEDFTADNGLYKDYPLKILFKKLAEGGESEKREIRNLIVLKQVFDRNVMEKDKARVMKYKEVFGVVKNITKDNLKLWIPGTNDYRNYYVGIDRIPIEKTGEHIIIQSNIGEYASVIYTLDERIYKIKIDFQLAVPKDLYVERKDDRNIVGWSEVSKEKIPHGYKLFLNGEPIKIVEDTSTRVPRTKGRVDSYYVKAIYKHGEILIESAASDLIYDKLTAKELQQELL
ncbi:hypothetical protein ACFL7M_16420, partial [Thermodesulfobacteriota bacterium]